MSSDLTATSTVLSSSNLKRRLRLAITRLLSWPVLAARSVATRLRNIVAWGPIPPVVENTRPLRVPFSICVQRSLCFLSLLLSWCPYILAVVLCLALDLAKVREERLSILFVFFFYYKPRLGRLRVVAIGRTR